MVIHSKKECNVQHRLKVPGGDIMAFRSTMLISTSIIAAALATTSIFESAYAQAPAKSVVLNVASLGLK